MITLAVVRSATPGDQKPALDALCRALGKLIGEQVVGILPPSYAALAAGLERDQIQYAWMPPALVVLTEEQIKLQTLLVAVRNEHMDYCSALFVDGASRFHTVHDLAGHTIAWVDQTSASGYLCPRIQLASHGIDPARHFNSELFLGSHEGVVRAVFDGKAAAGATYAEPPFTVDGPVTRAGFLDVDPTHPVRVIDWSPRIPNDVICGHGLIALAEQRVFSNAILTLGMRDDGRELLYNAFHADRFAIAPQSTLRPLRELVKKAREHGLFNQL